MNLNDKYRYRIELHAHTKPASPCSEIPPAELIERYKKQGYDAVVITNHFFPGMPGYGDRERCLEGYFSDFEAACEAGRRNGIRVLLGMEIRFSENANDYLVYGIDRADVEASYDALERGLAHYYSTFKNERNVILQAHPFRSGMELADPACIDGVETFNMHPGHNSRVAVAARYAREHDFIVSAGTDFHHPGHEGMAALRAKELPRDSFDVARMLKSRDYIFEVGGTLVLPYGQ